MLELKRRNATWVILTDVDEYVAFNRIREDDPDVPLDYAPEGVPTLKDWKLADYSVVDATGVTSWTGEQGDHMIV